MLPSSLGKVNLSLRNLLRNRLCLAHALFPTLRRPKGTHPSGRAVRQLSTKRLILQDGNTISVLLPPSFSCHHPHQRQQQPLQPLQLPAPTFQSLKFTTQTSPEIPLPTATILSTPPAHECSLALDGRSHHGDTIALLQDRSSRDFHHTRDPATSHQQPSPLPTPPERAFAQPILSLQSPATVQSGSLWRNPCVGGTLAGNYRVGDYNVDYSAQESHPGEQSQQQHGYDTTPSHQHHRSSIHHGAAHTPSLHDPSPGHHSHHPAMPQHHSHHSHHSHHVLMDPGHQLGHARHLGPPHYGAPGPVVAPLYPSMTTPTQSHTPHGAPKRSRPDELDLSLPGMPDLEQTDLESMQHTPLGSAYGQTGVQQVQPTHHHHRLPDTSPPSKMMRRDGDIGDRGGAPSVVGQAGMPAPAPRPRGPKLKFTPEDDQLLIDLKENKSLTWKQIADFFPGRSSGTLQVRYCTKLKAKTTQWTEETDQKLRTALQDYENEKWRIVANKVGTGFTPAACRERAQELIEGISAPL
nr:MYB DNA-binding domain-containing protein [Colletotrichum truncatum]KAF6784059.1 MYB DNA-binding domain-containing protein [Colletotrichum truncatum]